MNEQNLEVQKEQDLFNTAHADKILEATKKAMPHQTEMQVLIKKKLKEIFQNIKQDKLEVVELGTGTGFTSKQILEADQRIKLISVDKELKMVEEAKKNLHEYLDNGRIEIKEIGALEFLKSFPDNSVDSVATGFTLHNFFRDYRENTLLEIFRVLKPGGKFVSADKVMPDDPEEFIREYNWQIESFKNAGLDEVTRQGWMDHYEHDNREDIIMREADLTNFLKSVGFKNILINERHHLDVMIVAEK
ncbi:MAG: class I SAM-dependent methyltransferase [Patescibacteria group bacterium]|jgi:ubiquinone/menaquinone biosynthesis C-methylase UbiE